MIKINMSVFVLFISETCSCCSVFYNVMFFTIKWTVLFFFSYLLKELYYN